MASRRFNIRSPPIEPEALARDGPPSLALRSPESRFTKSLPHPAPTVQHFAFPFVGFSRRWFDEQAPACRPSETPSAIGLCRRCPGECVHRHRLANAGWRPTYRYRRRAQTARQRHADHVRDAAGAIRRLATVGPCFEARPNESERLGNANTSRAAKKSRFSASLIGPRRRTSW